MSTVQRIQNLCSNKDLTLIGLEREIGLGRGTIRNWDKNAPSSDKLLKVANYFNVSIDYLIGRVDNENNQSQLSCAFFRVAKEAQDQGFNPDDIKLAMDFIKKAQQRNQ